MIPLFLVLTFFLDCIKYLYMINKSYVKLLVEKYQKIFRCEDWDIQLRFPSAKNSSKFAYSEINYMSRKVVMSVYETGSKEATMEEVIRHEFAHILNSGLYSFLYSLKKQGKISEADFAMLDYYNELYCCGFERIRVD